MTELALWAATAAAPIWLGMAVAISFLEASLKFRAEGLDLRVGRAIGRTTTPTSGWRRSSSPD